MVIQRTLIEYVFDHNQSVPVEYVPNPHDEHAVAPALSENVPGSQLSHEYGPPRCPLRSEFMAE